MTTSTPLRSGKRCSAWLTMRVNLDAAAVHTNGQRRIDQAGRPRERLLQYGAHTLTDAELVSLLLSTGVNTVQVAERLLEAVGGIPGLARWHPEALCRLPGLGAITAARLVAALAIPQRPTMNCHTAANTIGLKFLGHLVLGEHDSWEQAKLPSR